MPSFSVVNYSLRPSKNIQRQLVFEGLRTWQERLNIKGMVYIGLGSVWFSDFIMAHRILNINDMISIECDHIGYKRALFNKPYSTVRVLEGYSHEVLPTLFRDPMINDRPWIVWLDYDKPLNETLRDDAQDIIDRSPEDSVLIVTFKGTDTSYGRARQRPQRLRRLLGDLVPDDLTPDDCSKAIIHDTLASLTVQFMQARAATNARPGGFIPGFGLVYQDTSLMITVGGMLPSESRASSVSGLVNSTDWKCQIDSPIVAPHLTLREILALQAALPRKDGLTRELVRRLGFDLESEKIDAFSEYYREYPFFAQVLS